MSEPKPPTICGCGLPKSYHEGPWGKDDHTYEPRYEPMAWREGFRAGRQEAVREIRTATAVHHKKYGGLPLAVVERILDRVARDE